MIDGEKTLGGKVGFLTYPEQHGAERGPPRFQTYLLIARPSAAHAQRYSPPRPARQGAVRQKRTSTAGRSPYASPSIRRAAALVPAAIHRRGFHDRASA